MDKTSCCSKAKRPAMGKGNTPWAKWVHVRCLTATAIANAERMGKTSHHSKAKRPAMGKVKPTHPEQSRSMSVA